MIFSQNGIDLIEEIVQITAPMSTKQKYYLRVFVIQRFVDVALAGTDVATLPYGTFMKLFKHPLTDSGNARF